jgi:hypothetical protein
MRASSVVDAVTNVASATVTPSSSTSTGGTISANLNVIDAAGNLSSTDTTDGDEDSASASAGGTISANINVTDTAGNLNSIIITTDGDNAILNPNPNPTLTITTTPTPKPTAKPTPTPVVTPQFVVKVDALWPNDPIANSATVTLVGPSTDNFKLASNECGADNLANCKCEGAQGDQVDPENDYQLCFMP